MSKLIKLAVLALFVLACGVSGPSANVPTVFAPTLPTLPDPATATEVPATIPPVQVHGDWNCRTEPNMGAEIVVVVLNGMIIQPTNIQVDGWTLVEYGEFACWMAGW